MVLGREKVSFLHVPTPIDYLPNISSELGVAFYLKRDDLTGPGIGGNKLRKLEYLLKEALDRKATLLLTVGGAQTNHGRLTAAVAAKYGLKCAIACIGDYPGEMSGNILPSRLMGAEIVFRKSDGGDLNEQLEALALETAARYEAQGEKVYAIPLGGSTDTGMLGYYECAMELTRQAREMTLNDARVITPVGSLGTCMGLHCGFRNEGSPLRCTGIFIMPCDDAMKRRLVAYCASVNAAFDLHFTLDPADFAMEAGYVRGGYNVADKNVREAIYLMAEKEGIILDPCYTGKCFAGVIDMIREGRIEKGEKLILIHTGGLPGIYTPHHRLELEKELIGGVTVQA